jgi:3-deoxy-D-manno-octulosonate 8-phosphate phosphatase KdsC-like HAD superfamily phosphatase
MKDLLEKASHMRLLIIDVDGVLTDDSLERLSRVRGTIDSSNDGNG